jgi:nitroreductase
MELFQAIQTRRSVRAFTSQPIPETALQQILAACNQAPSAGNLQAYEIYVVRQPAQKQALTDCANGQGFLLQAPVVLAFCTHAKRAEERYGKRGTGLYTTQDATIACTYAMLAATGLGLATVWVGAFDEKAAQEAISAPEGVIPIAMLPIGYPAENPPARPRRALNEIVHEV